MNWNSAIVCIFSLVAMIVLAVAGYPLQEHIKKKEGIYEKGKFDEVMRPSPFKKELMFKYGDPITIEDEGTHLEQQGVINFRCDVVCFDGNAWGGITCLLDGKLISYSVSRFERTDDISAEKVCEDAIKKGMVDECDPVGAKFYD